MERDEISNNGGARPKTTRRVTQNSGRQLNSSDEEFFEADRHRCERLPEGPLESSTKDSEAHSAQKGESAENYEECDNLPTLNIPKLQTMVKIFHEDFKKKYEAMKKLYPKPHLFEFANFEKKVTKAVGERFDTLCKSLKLIGEKKRSLAAFVISERNTEETSYKIVSMAVGGQRIEDEYFKGDGYTVNDCHAIVLARRGLLLYLYNHVTSAACRIPLKHEESIFFHNEGKLALKGRFKIHLYTNVIPCGCARFKEPEGSKKPSDFSLSIKSPNSLGMLKMDKSINSRSRMSCSDKILKWNVLGLQGAILSRYMKPVYMESIYIKPHVCDKHIEFALSERYLTEFVKDLPAPFTRNKPTIYTDHVAPSIEEVDQYAFQYDCYSQHVEILDLETGGLVHSGIQVDPRVCKYNFFERFNLIHKHDNPDSNMSYYKAIKEHDINSYQMAKRIFMKTLESCGYGSWVRNDEKDEFHFQVGDDVRRIEAQLQQRILIFSRQ